MIERIVPILNVGNLKASVEYYVGRLGFSIEFETEHMVGVSRDGHQIMLCLTGQGHSGTWVWIGVEDVEKLLSEFQASGAIIRHLPQNYPWALEMKVMDPDGHVLRFGSEPNENEPFVSFSF